MNVTTTTNGIRPAGKIEHERSARHAESSEKRKPKTNWAWADGSRHFDWMDWHTHAALPISTDFDL
ncbi:hypothetical protein PQR02_30995 [Paraburkholderia sediminicola]|uniref:Uncharacterized protein n=1 Tax=Paraburkholderia rhynchosiae TaxID=487049 RepID=A0ACC7NJP3_9BURK